jgi:hypothetical protein
MKRLIGLAIWSAVIAVPSWLMAQEAQEAYDHGSVGIFADYFRFAPTSSETTNFVGVGGRAAFNPSPNVAIEGEMSYDFSRNFTTTCHNCLVTAFVTTSVRPLTGLFGPKFQTRGPFKFFVTGKVGFINFQSTTHGVTPGVFFDAVSGVGGSGTHFAVYPGGGFEGFWGPFGLRLEAGDEIYFNNGTFNNLRLTFGPQLRF